MDFLSTLGSLVGMGGSGGLGQMDLMSNDPSKLLNAGKVGVANNLGAGVAGLANAMDLSAGQDAMKIGMANAMPEKQPFDLKGLATDLQGMAEKRAAQQQEAEKSMQQQMAQDAAASGLSNQQGVMAAAPPQQAQQVAQAMAQPSPAMAAMSGGMGGSPAMQAMQGQPQQVGIGAQPSVQEMMRRIYGR